jgi:hypothetical protein
MVIATYSLNSGMLIEPKFRKIYPNGYEITVLYIDGSKKKGILKNGKVYA